MSMHMAGAITARREALGLSQTALARRAGISRAHLNQVESGKIALPSADFRRKLAGALGVPHVQLLVWAGELTASEVSGATPADEWTDEQRAWLQSAHARLDRYLVDVTAEDLAGIEAVARMAARAVGRRADADAPSPQTPAPPDDAGPAGEDPAPSPADTNDLAGQSCT